MKCEVCGADASSIRTARATYCLCGRLRRNIADNRNGQPAAQTPSVATSALLGWLRGKLADAEKSLRAREDMANAKAITAEEWYKLLKMPGVRVTKGRKLTKAEIKDLEEAPLRHQRIAVKCRHDVEMFRAIISALTQPNIQDHEHHP